MIRFIRAVIYSIAAAIAASFFIDWLDRTGGTARRLEDGIRESDAIDSFSEEDKKAMLDELAAQL